MVRFENRCREYEEQALKLTRTWAGTENDKVSKVIPMLNAEIGNCRGFIAEVFTPISPSVQQQTDDRSPNPKDDEILHPNVFLVVRQNGENSTVYRAMGRVVETKMAIRLKENTLTSQDNVLALPLAGAVSLDDSGLAAGGAFRHTTNPLIRGDELHVFDNTAAGFNKSAAATYYYYNSGWRRINTPPSVNVGSTNIFTPGTGFLIRKAPGTNSPVWVR